MDMSEQSSEHLSRDRRTPEWNSDKAQEFDDYEQRLMSSILRKNTTTRSAEGIPITYNLGSTIVYLANKVTHAGIPHSADTLTRNLNPSLVSSPKDRVIAMIRAIDRRPKIPTEYALITSIVAKLETIDNQVDVSERDSNRKSSRRT